MKINFDPSHNGLYVEVDNILGEFTGDFEACTIAVLCVWGHFEAKLKNKGASLHTNLDLSGLRDGDKIVPRPQLENF